MIESCEATHLEVGRLAATAQRTRRSRGQAARMARYLRYGPWLWRRASCIHDVTFLRRDRKRDRAAVTSHRYGHRLTSAKCERIICLDLDELTHRCGKKTYSRVDLALTSLANTK